MSPFQEFLLRFVRQYDDCKLAILATGGGISLGQLASIPGASKILHSFYSPYETKASMAFIERHYPPANPENFARKAVCAESAEDLFMALWSQNKVDGHVEIHNIAITAACTSQRWRRGDNHAFIAFQNPKTLADEIWHLKLDKMDEQLHGTITPGSLAMVRVYEDELISMVALHLATGFTDPALHEDRPGTFIHATAIGTVSRIRP